MGGGMNAAEREQHAAHLLLLEVDETRVEEQGDQLLGRRDFVHQRRHGGHDGDQADDAYHACGLVEHELRRLVEAERAERINSGGGEGQRLDARHHLGGAAALAPTTGARHDGEAPIAGEEKGLGERLRRGDDERALPYGPPELGVERAGDTASAEPERAAEWRVGRGVRTQR